jgi:hypothetical protein
MNSWKLSKLSLLGAAFVVGLVIADHASAARGGGHSGGGRAGHGHGHHHHGVFFGGSAGVFLGSWDYPGYYYSPAYSPAYYPGYAYMQPPLVMYFIERGDEDAPADAWFFCPSANAYFPTVTQCPTPWQRVPAQP